VRPAETEAFERVERVDVAVVGGGPAGSAFAARVVRAGLRVVILEARPTWTWQAGGVFASPATMRELRGLGLEPAVLDAVARPIPAMNVETPRGATIRLTYGTERGGDPAVGLDRSTLDPALLELAWARGAEIRRPATVVGIDRSGGYGGDVRLRVRHGTVTRPLDARVVVGADGHRSVVAQRLGVDRPARLGSRVGMTWHLAHVGDDGPGEARMVVLDGAYCGLAPVPGGRLNVGIVLASRRWQDRLAVDGAAAVGRAILARVPDAAWSRPGWRDAPVTDAIAGASPLGHRVTHRAGDGWVLIGDAAGFLDPFTGEGLHRALVSSRLAADAVIRALRAEARDDDALRAYDRAMRRRFRSKDVVSLLVQGFLARPAIFDYAAQRVARRDGVRATMGLVMGDLVPASQALDPRFLAALLAP
jgi:flavin-dependent dehydrogenase